MKTWPTVPTGQRMRLGCERVAHDAKVTDRWATHACARLREEAGCTELGRSGKDWAGGLGIRCNTPNVFEGE